MNITQNCIDIIKDTEGLETEAYQDTGGIWTIGYGSTRPDGEPVVEGQTCTVEQAEKWLMDEINENCIPTIMQHVTVPLTQNQIDALADFIYNLGEPQFMGSTLLKKLNTGDYEGAAAQFKRWDKDDGVVQPGLVKRRKREVELFLKT